MGKFGTEICAATEVLSCFFWIKSLSLSEHCTSVQFTVVSDCSVCQWSTTGDEQEPELLGVRFPNDFVFAASQFISS